MVKSVAVDFHETTPGGVALLALSKGNLLTRLFPVVRTYETKLMLGGGRARLWK